MEAAREGQRPRDAHATVDTARREPIRARNEPNEGGFTGAVATEDADFLAALDLQVDLIEHGKVSPVNRVALGDVF